MRQHLALKNLWNAEVHRVPRDVGDVIGCPLKGHPQCNKTVASGELRTR